MRSGCLRRMLGGLVLRDSMFAQKMDVGFCKRSLILAPLALREYSSRPCYEKFKIYPRNASSFRIQPRQVCAAFRAACSQSGAVGGSDPGDWPEHEFVKVAEASLEHISEQVSEFGFDSKSAPSDFDIELSQGVLTIGLGADGTYVLNTQTPNRQIWMSSPSSGPWRYDWNPEERQWVSTRDGHPLSSRLTEELSAIFKEPVSISFRDVS